MGAVNSRNKYIIVSPFFPTPEKYNGPFVYDLAMAISRLTQYEVVVFKPVGWRERCQDYEYGGVRVHCFKTYDLPSYILNGICDPLNSISFSKKWKTVGIDAADVAAVHGHTVNCGVYCNYLKSLDSNIITLLHHHDPDPYKILHGKFYTEKLNLLFRAHHSVKVVQSMDWNVSVSSKVNENLLSFPKAGKREYYEPYLSQLQKLPNSLAPVLTHDRCIVLYNGVDDSIFYPNECLKSDTSLFVVGCNANYVNWKRQDILIRAIKRVKDSGFNVQLRLLGTNPIEGFIRTQILVENLNLADCVSFLPPCDHSELQSFYTDLDLFVLPSVFEGFGCVFTEAYACGVPFMSCKGQAIEEIVADKDRILFFAEPEIGRAHV